MANEEFFCTPFWTYGIPLLVVVIVMLLNMFGVDFLGNLSGVFLLITLSPFVVLFVWSAVTGIFPLVSNCVLSHLLPSL